MSVTDLTTDLQRPMVIGTRIDLTHGNTQERFILTCYGRTPLWVSLDTGYAYTRPQLIEKYQIVGAELEIVKVQS